MLRNGEYRIYIRDYVEAASLTGDMMMAEEHDPDLEEDLDSGDDQDFSTTIVIENNDNVGGVSVEINVADLVADIEAAKESSDKGAAARRRLEALLEEKRLKRLLDEDDDFYIDDL
ncbi:MAG: hypothetical protein AAF290_11630 [Pseudomonadota bacterium]